MCSFLTVAMWVYLPIFRSPNWWNEICVTRIVFTLIATRGTGGKKCRLVAASFLLFYFYDLYTDLCIPFRRESTAALIPTLYDLQTEALQLNSNTAHAKNEQDFNNWNYICAYFRLQHLKGAKLHLLFCLCYFHVWSPHTHTHAYTHRLV